MGFGSIKWGLAQFVVASLQLLCYNDSQFFSWQYLEECELFDHFWIFMRQYKIRNDLFFRKYFLKPRIIS